MLSALAELKKAIEEFKVWADRYSVGDRSGEWECDYEQWPRICTAFSAYLDTCAPQKWDDEIIELLLYILARDNEVEILKNELMSRPAHLMALAEAGIHSIEQDARWQLADALGGAELRADEVEPLLERFFNDEDEYVSRRALLALGRRRSPKAEVLAQRAWETGLEYQRIAALEVLSSLNSQTLSSYLVLAQQDGREYLASSASRILSKHSQG
jgi:HEAT repeat protein